MDSNLMAFIQIALGVFIFLFAGLYYVTKWAEIEIEIEDMTTTRSQNEVTFNLYYLKNISKDELNLLLQEKISNIEYLTNNIKTEKDMIDFSEKLGIRRKLVEEWVTLGEFSSLYGMTGDYIHLLNRVGIKSVEDLKKENPYFLWKKLYENNLDAEPIPSLGMIKYWVRNSNKIKLKLTEQIREHLQ